MLHSSQQASYTASSPSSLSFTHTRISPDSLLPPAFSPSMSRRRFSSLLPLLLLLLLMLLCLCPSPLRAQDTASPATPYVAPTCLDSAFLLAHGLSLPPPSSSRPLVVLERDGWAGHYLTTALAAQLLQDVLGYSVSVVDVDSTWGDLTSVFSRLGQGTVQMNFEVWPNSQAETDYAQYVLQGLAVNAGPLGLVEQSGWYVPTATVNMWWDDYLDFWKGYLYAGRLTAFFPVAGSTPDSLKAGYGREFVPPWCWLETEPAGCQPSFYNPDYLAFRCNITRYNPDCIEMWAIDALRYDPGVLQQQVYNLGLNITIPFLGEENYLHMLWSALDANTSFLAYNWIPNVETAGTQLSRVALPSYNDACWLDNQNASLYFDGIGSVNCDFPAQSILKYYSASLLQDSAAVSSSYRDALTLLSSFNFANRYQQSLLQLMVGMNRSDWQTFADSGTCGWLLEFVHLWSTWIQLSPQPYILSLSTASIASVLTIVGLLGGYSLLLHAFLWRHRRHPLVIGSSPLFGQIIIGGSWFLYVAIAVMAWKQVDGVCSVIPAFLCAAYVLVIGTVFAKTWRLNRIFHGATLKSVRASAWDVLLFITAFGTYDLIINTAWNVVDRPVASLTSDSTHTDASFYVCSSSHWIVWYVLLIVPKALLLLYGAFLAYNVRHISANFNESRYIGLAILHFILFGVIVIPLDQALEAQQSVHYLLITLMLCLCIFVTLSLLFLPKIYAIAYKKKGKRRAEVKDDSDEPQQAGAPGATHRWVRQQAVIQQTDSDKLSFPSLSTSSGAVHALRVLRFVAEQVYHDCGIYEYWQFCLAVRSMSQAELEARAPLLVAYLNQVKLQQTAEKGRVRRIAGGQDTGSNRMEGEEEKEGADNAATTQTDPLSQASIMEDTELEQRDDSRVQVHIELSPLQATTATLSDCRVRQLQSQVADDQEAGAEQSEQRAISRPVTQDSFSFTKSALHTSDLGGPGADTAAAAVASPLTLPPLPSDAWVMADTLPSLFDTSQGLTELQISAAASQAAPLLALPAAAAAAAAARPRLTQHSSASSLVQTPSPVSASSVISPASFPLSVPIPAGQSYAASFVSQQPSSFSMSQQQPNAAASSFHSSSMSSEPSPSSRQPSSLNSPSSLPNHHSSTSNHSDSASGSNRNSGRGPKGASSAAGTGGGVSVRADSSADGSSSEADGERTKLSDSGSDLEQPHHWRV